MSTRPVSTAEQSHLNDRPAATSCYSAGAGIDTTSHSCCALCREQSVRTGPEVSAGLKAIPCNPWYLLVIGMMHRAGAEAHPAQKALLQTAIIGHMGRYPRVDAPYPLGNPKEFL